MIDTYQDSSRIIYVESKSNNMAVASLILGIVGLLGALIPILYFFGWALGVTGFILGCLAVSKAKQLDGMRKTMSKFGIVLSIAAIGMGTWGFITVQNAVDDLNASINGESPALSKSGGKVSTGYSPKFKAYSKCLDKADTLAEIDACG